jgi:alkylation response protein AidB-like acyl-CoA dehydrogenase
VADNKQASTARQEVREWLVKSLPPKWMDSVESGRAPGSFSAYPDFELEDWIEQLFGRRFLMAAWPESFGGLALPADEVTAIYEEFSRCEAPLPLWVSPLLMCGNAILESGTDEQKARFLPDMASGQELWCQLFSEPEAGSDLASLRTRATQDGDHWVIEGQKVWTTFAHVARWGMLLARTDPTVAKHRGITAFIVDMQTPGVDVRPLRQITGDASFNEVFMDGVVVPDVQRIGLAHRGWGVTVAMLQHERGILSSQRVGGIDIFRLLDRHRGRADPVTRQRLASAYVRFQVTRMMQWRGYGEGVEAQVTKVLQTESNRDLQGLALDLEGMAGVAIGPDDPDRQEISYGFLRSRANTIAGGTSEVMRNVIGERLLGLPRESGDEAPRR